MSESAFLKDIKAIMIDIDGTLLNGKQPLPGLSEFIDFLNRRALKFTILTNNSTKTPQDFLEKMRSCGAPMGIDNVLTCATVTAHYLKANYPGRKAFLIGETGIQSALEEQGIRLVPDFSEAVDFVVVGGDHFLTYEKLKYACLHLQRGALLVGTNPDVVYPAERGFIPECGANIAALEACSGNKAIVIGKPNRLMYEWGLERLACSPAQTAMLGDRLETDIFGGKQAGLWTILVETGVDSSQSVLKKGIYPDLVVRDLPDLVSKWDSQFD